MAPDLTNDISTTVCAHIDAQVLVGHPHLVVRLGTQVDRGSPQVVACPDPVHEQRRDQEGVNDIVRRVRRALVRRRLTVRIGLRASTLGSGMAVSTRVGTKRAESSE